MLEEMRPKTKALIIEKAPVLFTGVDLSAPASSLNDRLGNNWMLCPDSTFGGILLFLSCNFALKPWFPPESSRGPEPSGQFAKAAFSAAFQSSSRLQGRLHLQYPVQMDAMHAGTRGLFKYYFL